MNKIKVFSRIDELKKFFNDFIDYDVKVLAEAKEKLAKKLEEENIRFEAIHVDLQAKIEKAGDDAELVKKLTAELKEAKSAHKAKIRIAKQEEKEPIKTAKENLSLRKKRARILLRVKRKELVAWEKAGLDPNTTESEVEKLISDSFKPELVEDDILLSVRHLKQYFGSSSGGRMRTKAVHDISFDVHKGEVFGLVGESGCGKTTTGRSLIRLYDITSGSVYYKGHRISGGTRWNKKEIKWKKISAKQQIKELKAACKEALSDAETTDEDITLARQAKIKEHYQKEIEQVKYEIAEIVRIQKAKIKLIEFDNQHVKKEMLNEIQMIFQDPSDSLDPRMTVEDTIQEGLQIQGMRNKGQNSLKVSEVLEMVGLLPEYSSRYPHEFSGGQRQRIGIARATIMRPEFLICDEPVSALDVSIRAQVINLLSDLRDEMGLTLLFIAHDLSLVKYFCDRIAVMYFGKIVELAPSNELFAHPLHPYTKSLISAIPKPDPISEKGRQRIIYNPATAHNYSEEGGPELVEILPGHWVLANEKELANYNEEIKQLDKIAAAKKEVELEEAAKAE